MPYTEKYPLNPTPQGDSTKDAVLKNREEIKTIGNVLAAQSKGGGSGLRQRILYGKNSGGKYSFLSNVGLSIIIDGSNIPVVLTLADGFNENGAKDYVETINKKINAWTLPGNATSYLFVERSISGSLSYDSVAVKPIFANALSSGIPVGSHVFNTLEQKMYMYNGTEWKAVVRVFVAAVTTNSTAVTKIEYMNNAAAVEITEGEKEKLSGIESGAEVNQNAFSKIKVDGKTFSAAVKQAVLEFIAGDNISIGIDDASGKLTIKVDGTVANATSATQDSSGNQIDATYVKSVTYSGQTVTVTRGDGDTNSFKTKDTTYSLATNISHGLMSLMDKKKLDNIAEGANAGITSAIESSSLNDTGAWWVKFHGGLIIQGGFISGGNVNDFHNFPVALSICLHVSAMWVGETWNYPLIIKEYNTQRFKLGTGSNWNPTAKACWLAIGV